jgi:hypothetical protein
MNVIRKSTPVTVAIILVELTWPPGRRRAAKARRRY